MVSEYGRVARFVNGKQGRRSRDDPAAGSACWETPQGEPPSAAARSTRELTAPREGAHRRAYGRASAFVNGEMRLPELTSSGKCVAGASARGTRSPICWLWEVAKWSKARCRCAWAASMWG